MAQIILNVDVNTKDVSAAVSTIKTQFSSLSQSLSSLTVNKDLTAQLKALADYYKQLALAGEKATKAVSRQSVTGDKAARSATMLKDSYLALQKQYQTLSKQYAAGTFDVAKRQLDEVATSVDKLYNEFQASKTVTDEQAQALANLQQKLRTIRTDMLQLALDAPKAVSEKPVTEAVSNVDTLRKGYANLANQLKTLKEQYPAGVFAKADQQIQKNLESVKALSEAYKNGNWGDEERKEVRALSKEYKSLAADVAQVRFEENKLATSEPFSPKQGDSIFRLQKRYSALLTAIKSVEQYYPKGTFDQITTGAQEAVPALKALGQEYVTTGTLSDNSQKKLNTFTSAIHQQEAAFKDLQATATNYHGTLRDLIAGFAKFQLSAMLVMQPLNLLRNALQSINETLVETEDAVISIQRVLDENIAAGTISNEIYRIAQELGQTFDVVQEIAQNFAKAGLNWQKTLQATEAAVLALNVAELSAAESSEGLIAIMQQFGYEASQLTYVIDVLNKAADKSAVDTQELLVALQKTGSYAKTANLSLEQTVALITAMSEATAASGQNIGNALKSLFAYTTKDSALDVFAALSTDSAAVVAEYRKGAASILDVWKQVASELDNLNAEQGSLLDRYFATEEGSALEEELSGELQGVYDDIKGIYDTAGVYRKNYFLALLGNMEEVEKVLGVVGDAAGYTMTEQEKYMETYTAKLNALQSQWEELITDEQGWLSFKKGLLDIGSALLTLIDNTGGLRTTIIALGFAVTTAFAPTVVKSIGNFVDGIKNMVSAFRAGTISVQTFGTALQVSLGIIGLVVTAISAIVGAVQQYNEEIRQARIESVNAWQESKAQAEQLQELYDKYNQLKAIQDKTTEQENEYIEVQKELLELFGDKKKALEDLKVGTDEYREAIENLTEAKLNLYHQDLITAQESAEDLLSSQSFDSLKIGTATTDAKGNLYWDNAVVALLKSAGFDVDYIRRLQFQSGSTGDLVLGGIDSNKTVEAALHNQALYLKAQEALYDTYNKYIQEGNFEAAEEISGSDFWQTLANKIAESESVIDDYFDTTVAKLMIDYEKAFGEVENAAEHEQMTQWIIDQIGVDEYWDDTIRELIGSFHELGDETEDTGDDVEDFTGKIEELGDKTEDLIDALRDAKDATDDLLALDEKRLAISEAQADVIDAQNELLKAQQALENAKNSRTVRRLNSRTGEFEWVADEDKIAEAEEDVQDALDNLADAQESVADAIKDYNDYIRDQAFDAVIDALEEGDATNESILEIIKEWAAKAYGTDSPAWVDEIINVLKQFGIDFSEQGKEDGKDESENGGKPTKRWTSYQDAADAGYSNIATATEWVRRKNTPGSEMSKYETYQDYLNAMYDKYVGDFDSGGLAYGRGIMVKDTDKPEAVLPPDIVEKILTPTSNAQLQKYIDTMGLMFENANAFMTQMPSYSRIGAGNTTNNNTNSNNNISINGLKVGTDQYQRPFIDVVAEFSQIPRV